VGIGALFGLGDWRYEILGLLMHAIELEKRFGIGPHTISFPRVVKAHNLTDIRSTVTDNDMKKIVTIIRLSVPYTGMILTARENAELRKKLLTLGVTQTDADSKIDIGGYSKYQKAQDELKQQFILGDTRTLDEVVRELAELGFITSFCTAGYRCGRTGEKIMELLRSGTEGKFCKLNAVLTFKEWLDDFASDKTKEIGEKLISKEIEEIKEKVSIGLFNEFIKSYNRIANGERDLYF
ncbi:MAG: hypothetical protein N2053_12875, partial [Chitinispirillaceae bacterium]|nr:hypothetical protein [Chitinispirillaceae bacterium]